MTVIKNADDIFLRHILQRWVQLVEDGTIWQRWTHGNHAAPWSFGELAATSTLAGAVWLSSGFCLQERLSKKWDVERYRGAADLRLWGSDAVNQYSFEAKWSRVSIAARRKPLYRMDTLLRRACEDSRTNIKPKGGYSQRDQQKFGIAFASIESLPDADRDRLWDGMIEQLRPAMFFDFGYAARSDAASFAKKLDSDGVVLLGRRADVGSPPRDHVSL